MTLGRIGVFGFDQPLDHSDHFRNGLGCQRHHVRSRDAQGTKVFKIKTAVTAGDGLDGHLLSDRGGHDLVLDVSDVRRVNYAVLAVNVAKEASEGVKNDRRSRVSDMRAV